MTPNDATNEIDTKTPPVAYADVVFRHQTKPPKEVLTQQQIDSVPELKQDIANDPSKDDEPTQYTKEQLEQIRNEIKKSSRIVGIRPVSIRQINEEAKKTKSQPLSKKIMKITKKLLQLLQRMLYSDILRDQLKNGWHHYAKSRNH